MEENKMHVPNYEMMKMSVHSYQMS